MPDNGETVQNLVKQEQFELEILDCLNSARLLRGLVFCGGTMLRLCYGLNRFSVDLDFWLREEMDHGRLFGRIKECLGRYEITDAADKFHTMLFEIRCGYCPRALKIEIRKETRRLLPERSIAFSKFSNLQVLLDTVALKDMMASKIDALVSRKEIRDAFDMEFLFKKGIKPEASAEKLQKAGQTILSFTRQDYAVKLGSLLEEKERKYYSSENFKILRMALDEALAAKQ